jgi:DNA-binding NtrC family response regulator
VAYLSQLEWPGNIRQLENMVYRAVAMSEGGDLGLSDFPQAANVASPSIAEAVGEPLLIEPAPRPMIPGNEIPIAPMTAPGSLSMLTSEGEVRPLEELESEIIRFAIAHYRGQMSEVARRLKIGRSTLYRKIDEDAGLDRTPGEAEV